MLSSLEAFFDPASNLLIFYMVAPDPDQTGTARASQYAVLSSTSSAETASAVLVAVVDVRYPGTWGAARIPKGHNSIRVRAFSRADSSDDITLTIVETGSFEQTCVAIAWSSADDGGVRCRQFDGLLSEDDILRNLSNQYGDRLLWATSYGRSRLNAAGTAFEIAPAKLLWPIPGGLGIEALPMRWEAPPSDRFGHDQPVVLARMNEKLPRAALRLHLSAAIRANKLSLHQISLVHVMHQRLFLERINQARADENDKEAIARIVPLTLQKIRGWLNADVPIHALDAPHGLLVLNLSGETSALAEAGIIVRWAVDQSSIDVEFNNAVLGDDLGIAFVSARDGDLSVIPLDPKSDRRLRLFRMRKDRLDALQLDTVDGLPREILQKAARTSLGTDAEVTPAPPVSGRWGGLGRKIGLPMGLDRLGLGSRGPVAGLMVLAWADWGPRAARDGEPATVEAHTRFWRAPALVAALRRSQNVSNRDQILNETSIDSDEALPRQIAEAMGGADLVPTVATVDEWESIWSVMSDGDTARQLATARISLAGFTKDIVVARNVAAVMSDERRVEVAQESYEDRGSVEATPLLEYLNLRRKGEWSNFTTATVLTKSILAIEEIPLPSPPVPSLVRDTRDLATVRASVERLLESAAKAVPPFARLDALKADLKERAQNNRIDRRILRLLEQQLREYDDSPDMDTLAGEVISALDSWAGLDDFADKMKPRLRRGLGNGARRKRDIVQDLLNRVPRLPKLEESDNEFNRYRKDINRSITDRIKRDKRAQSDLAELPENLAAYGDILFHHRAWLALTSFAAKHESDPALRSDVAELRQRIRTWPLDAAEIWDVASDIATRLPYGGRTMLSNAAVPPKL
jgi:hypothetical protein